MASAARSGSPGRPAIYRRLLASSIRSQTQYPASFALDVLLNLAVTVLDVVVVLAVFRVAPALGGFSLREALLLAGVAELGFQLADLAVGNIERLPVYVRTGLLDAVLVRPLSSLGQLLVADAAPRRVGRVAQALAVYAVGLSVADVTWTYARIALALVAPLAGALAFAGIFVTGATLTFWLIEAGEVANAFTYGGRDFAIYPTSVYPQPLRWVFGYALGLATAAYLPTLALLGRADPLGLPEWTQWASPLVGVGWLVLAGLAWRAGVRHYRGTGS